MCVCVCNCLGLLISCVLFVLMSLACFQAWFLLQLWRHWLAPLLLPSIKAVILWFSLLLSALNIPPCTHMWIDKVQSGKITGFATIQINLLYFLFFNTKQFSIPNIHSQPIHNWQTVWPFTKSLRLFHYQRLTYSFCNFFFFIVVVILSLFYHRLSLAIAVNLERLISILAQIGSSPFAIQNRNCY